SRRASAAAPAAGASGCAGPPPPPAWRSSGRRCSGPAPRRWPWGSATRPGASVPETSQLLEDALVVGVDADVAGNAHRLVGDLARREGGVLEQRPRGG